QREAEGRAGYRFGIDPDLTAVPLHDPRAERQPHAGAARAQFLAAPEPLEHPEDILAVILGNAHAVVGYSHQPAGALLTGADGEPRGALGPRVLDRVIDLVGEEWHHARPTGLDHDAVQFDAQLPAASLQAEAPLRGDVRDHLGQDERHEV